MLRKEQIDELLYRCEKIIGGKLKKTRGDLKKGDDISPSILELLVIEACATIGDLEYEPYNGSPDIKLFLAEQRVVWIEITFLYPRFRKEERKSYKIRNWLFSEAKRHGIHFSKIYINFDGDRNNKAGPVRLLPDLHDRKNFLKNLELVKFFKKISAQPNTRHNCVLIPYLISISYFPNASKRKYKISGGSAQEAPIVVEEHAIFRKLQSKVKQHKNKVDEPYIVCIGSDQTPIFTSMYCPPNIITQSDAIETAFSKYKMLSAVIIVSIENEFQVFRSFGSPNRQIKAEMFLNSSSKKPLSSEESALILGKFARSLNKWRYSVPLENVYEKRSLIRGIGGDLEYTENKLKIPTTLLVHALAGKTNLIEEFGVKKNDKIYKILDAGWSVKNCSWEDGNVELGESSKIIIEFFPPKISL